jgi:hypothetical protein
MLPSMLKPNSKPAVMAPQALLAAPAPMPVAKTDPAVAAAIQKLDDRLTGLSLLIAAKNKPAADPVPVPVIQPVMPAPDAHATLEAIKPHKASSKPKADNEGVIDGATRWFKLGTK